MGFNTDWDTAGNHARQQIQQCGYWDCQCFSCQTVLRRSIGVVTAGKCAECQGPLTGLGQTYCCAGCKQKAYRDRKADQDMAKVRKKLRSITATT